MATKRKVKRFDEGGDADSGEWARGENYGDNTTGDERVAMARAPAREASAEEVMAANKFATAAKPNIVTKEQLAKSGYTNLRDYMNAQQGLTRRGGAAPERVAEAAKEVKSEVKAQEKANKYETPFDRMNRQNREASAAKAETDRETAKLRSAHPPKGRGVIDTRNIDSKTLLPRKMAKGGMTASRRADGIAQRGKTRGKLR